VLVPGGRSGKLFLIDPKTHEVSVTGGFSVTASSGGGHGEGITSIDAGGGFLFTVDRTALRLDVLDPASSKIVASAALSSAPDYVRYVEKAGEIWVTEPNDYRIEVFNLSSASPPVPAHSGFISVPGGPESLVIDSGRGLAYTNLWEDETITIDLRSRTPSGHWKNGCSGSRGLALDARRGFLFVGCAEGKASVLDIDHGGALLDKLANGSGVDIIAYDAALSHLYLPGARSATMAVLGVSAAGKLSLIGIAKVANGSHCVAVDDRHQAWVCDPQGGRLLLVTDSLGPVN
jgi:hypothetical protein